MNRPLFQLQFTVLLTAIFYFFFVVLNHLRTGFELSDSGFYLLQITRPEQITHTLTHFGIVWNSFFGDYGIVVNRAINLALLLSASLSLALTCKHLLGERMSKGAFGVLCALAVLGCSGQMALFILDPSYNSMAQSIVIFGIVLITMAADLNARRLHGATFLVSLGAGCAIAALVLIKASSAIAFMVFAIIATVVMAFRDRSVWLFPRMLIAGVLGSVAFFGFIEVSTGQMRHVVTSFSQGYEAYATAATHSASLLGTDAFLRFLRFVFGLDTLFPAGWIVLLFAILSLSAVAISNHDVTQTRWPLSVTGPALLFLGGALALMFTKNGLGTHLKINGTAFVIGWWVVIVFWKRRQFTLPQNVFLTGLLFAPFMTLYGTVNPFTFNIFAFGAAFSLIPAWILVSLSTARHAPVAGHLVLSLGILVAAVSSTNALKNPYGLLAPLSAAKTEVTFPDGNKLNLPSSHAAFLKGLGAHAHQLGSNETSPMVFDLTGELPIAPYWMDGRVPGAAWFVTRFSTDFSRKVFATLDPADLLNGWVILPVNDNGQIDPTATHFLSFKEVIRAAGTEFDEHFTPVEILTAPSFAKEPWRMQVMLYKPAAQLGQ